LLICGHFRPMLASVCAQPEQVLSCAPVTGIPIIGREVVTDLGEFIGQTPAWPNVLKGDFTRQHDR
jgi:hypothetical protein